MAGILNAELAFPQFPALDQYGPNTTLLLHGDGTNGAQNNTFLDSSTNNFTITRNGNTTQGTFSPFSQPNGYWSNYFNGSSDYLSTPSSTSFAFGTGDWTMEAWIYTNSTSTQRIISIVNIDELLLVNNGSIAYLNYFDGTTDFTNTSVSVPLNQWIHVAASRSSGTVRVFINGIIINTPSTSSANHTSASVCCIGRLGNQNIQYFNGYISNARVVKGTAVYTSNFTPSTTPLTAITNTSLLTCQSNYFKDNSSNAFAITANGTPSVQSFKPFSSPTSYFPAVNGGGGYFDGSGDYLNFTGGSPVTIGTNSATVECWVYPFGISSIQRLVASGTGDFSSGFFILRYNSSNFQAGSGTGNSITAAAPAANQWTHVAWVGSGGTTQTLYVNGVSVGTAGSYNLTSAISAIGGYWTGSGQEYFNGYLSGVRVVNGTAVYTGNFTPPTSPLTAIANTQLLLSMTNAGIIDSVSQNQLETVGNAQISTTQSKFGGSSMYFDGTGDYLSMPASQNFNLSSGDWTIECWINLSALTAEARIWSLGVYGTSPEVALLIGGGGAGGSTADLQLNYLGNATLITASNVNSTGVWNHVAVARSNGTTTLYVNGVARGTTTTLAWTSSSLNFWVGGWSQNNNQVNGYIDDLRITKGIARYTQNFTPPQNAYPDYGPLTNIPTVDPNFKNTTLLLHGNGTNGAQNNTFLDSSTNNFTITRNGNTTQGTFTPFSQPNGWWSNYFNGTTDYLTAPSNSAFSIGTGDFTVEAWVYVPSWPTYAPIFATNVTGGIFVGKNGSNFVLRAFSVADQLSTATLPPTNQWTHIAVVRSGSTATIYYNGVSIVSGTVTYNFAQGTAYIGNDAAAAYFSGYISNERVVKGTAVYTSNFTPSTLPLTAITNTSLLTCQSNRFLDNSTNAFTITPSGTPTVQNFYPFFPPLDYSTAAIGGSAYFDGSGDYLTAPSSSVYDMGSGDFTIEFWVYRLSSGGAVFHKTDPAGDTPGLAVWIQNDNLQFAVGSQNSWTGAMYLYTTATIPLYSWTHCACVRSGNNFYSFINGALSASTTSSITAYYNSSQDVYVGLWRNGDTQYLNANLYGLRVVKGGALYTSSFTPPITPFTTTVSSGTVSLLLNYTNGAIFDNASKNDLETVGNAQISTTQSKFGGSSMYFNGSSYLLGQTGQNTTFAGNFTIEYWAYPTSFPSTWNVVLDTRINGSDASGIWMGFDSSGKVSFLTAASVLIQNGTASTNTWCHVAFVRSGSTITAYLNGTSVGTATASTNYSSGNMVLGKVNDSASLYYNGYINDLRITKGIARYRYNFTPPAAPFPNK